MAHLEVHPVFIDGCFACKLSTLQFGRGESNRRNYVDTEAVEHTFGTKAEQEEELWDRTEGLGFFKPAWGPWRKDRKAPGGAKRKGELFRFDRRHKEYVGVTQKDMDKMLSGPEAEVTPSGPA